MTDEVLINLRAQCYCGKCEVQIFGAKESDGTSSYCHCSICRKLSGAPVMASLMLPNAKVKVQGETNDICTSKFVTRKRCKDCGSPVAATLGKSTTVVPLSLLDSTHVPKSWLPRHHLHYSDRIVDFPDDLPKYLIRYSGQTI
mmetsp:Transcript_1425/g.1867  ORF Transcript_1425/g.1867 Transcript_1425/m.1867 type:complete len:143 (+) Transcript_1425:281-709(+)